MKFANWLYNLNNTDQYILLGFFVFSLGLSYLTILIFHTWHLKIHGTDKYSHEFRITPFALTGIAFIYTVILYMSIGDTITRWIIELSK